MWYCLPDSSFLCVRSPETLSRVTLAMLGIGFQPVLAITLILTICIFELAMLGVGFQPVLAITLILTICIFELACSV